jgi:hypothetical protein
MVMNGTFTYQVMNGNFNLPSHEWQRAGPVPCQDQQEMIIVLARLETVSFLLRFVDEI